MVNAISDWHVWAWSGRVVAGAVLVAAVGYRILFLFLNRIARREGGLLVNSLVHRAKTPLRWILPFLAVLVVLPVARLPADVIGPTQRPSINLRCRPAGHCLQLDYLRLRFGATSTGPHG
jgi:hypothetical protein